MNKSMIYSGCFIWLSLISQALAAGAISVTIRSHCSVTLAGFPRSKKTCADWHLATPQHMAGHHLLSAFAEQRPRGPRSVEIVCAQGTQETMSYTCAYMSIHIISLYIYIHDYMNYMYMDTCIHLHVVCIIMCVYTLFLLILLYSCISIEHWCHMLSHPESTALSLGFATWHRWCEVWQAYRQKWQRHGQKCARPVTPQTWLKTSQYSRVC